MDTIRFKQSPRAIKAVGDGASFEGYGAVSANLDRQADLIAPGALGRAASGYLANGPIILWQHNDDEPIGRALTAVEDATGLLITASLTDTPAALKARKLVADNVITSMSIGYRCTASLHLDDDAALSSYMGTIGRVLPLGTKAPKYGVRVIQELEVVEISLVSVPANPNARITGVKGGKGRVSDVQEAVRQLRRWALDGRKFDRLGDGARGQLGQLVAQLKAAVVDVEAVLARGNDQVDDEIQGKGAERPAGPPPSSSVSQRLIELKRRALAFRSLTHED